jgi:ABC-type bacteriocin/lantibiotic exporter with double-glycine peptidase domain
VTTPQLLPNSPSPAPSPPPPPAPPSSPPSAPPSAPAGSARTSAAARAGSDARLTDPLLAALAYLGRAAGVDVDRGAARAALDRATREAAFEGPDAWFDELVRAGAVVGLRVRTLRRSPAEISAGSARGLFPIVTLAAGEGGSPRAVAVVEQRAGRARVEEIDSASREETWASGARLGAILGAGEADQVTWAIADPLEPLRPLGDDAGSPPSPFARLVSLLRLERDDIGVALVFAIGVGVVSLAAPIGVQALVNTVAFGGLLQPLVVLTLLVFVGLSFAGVLRAMQAYVIERIQRRVFARVAVDLAERLPRARVDALGKSHGPELVNRFFDVLTVQKGAATLLVDGASITLQIVVGTLVLAFYHPLLLVFDAGLIAAVAFVLFVLGRGAVKTSVKESKAKYAMAAWLEEIARHPLAFRSGTGAAYAADRAEDLLCGWLEARRKHYRVLFRQIAGSLVVQALASAALLGVGGFLVISGKLTLGQLVAAELIVTAVVAGIAKFGKHLESYYDLLAGVDKLGQLVDLPLETARGSLLGKSERGAALRIEGVSFAHAGGKDALIDVDLSVPPGGRVAVIGPSGAGKSTLADLIHGLLTPGRGRIDIDGMDLRDLDPRSVREEVALIRGCPIFEGTIADNVRVGRPDVHTSDVRAALSAVGLWEAVAALPEGLETRLATGGATLSQGEARRLVVARAIAGKPRLLLLDEALGDLDPASRRAVWGALFDPKAPWTLLVTAHDREALRGCDEIYVLSEGRLRRLRAGDFL